MQIVDHGSIDGAREILSEYDQDGMIRIISHGPSRGKGAAVRTGIEQARGDLILIQVAALDYLRRNQTVLIKSIQESIADVVYGSLFLGRQSRPVLFQIMVVIKCCHRSRIFFITIYYRIWNPDIRSFLGRSLSVCSYKYMDLNMNPNSR